jgi:hypothetical protein
MKGHTRILREALEEALQGWYEALQHRGPQAARMERDRIADLREMLREKPQRKTA